MTIVSVNYLSLTCVPEYLLPCLAFAFDPTTLCSRHTQTSAFGAPIFEQYVRLFRPNAILQLRDVAFAAAVVLQFIL